MSVAHAVLVAWLFAIGTFLVTQRALTRIILGLALLGHGAVLLLLLMGGSPGRPPIVRGDGDDPADVAGISAPLPQALALTAIVIGFGLTTFLLSLAWRSWWANHDDEVADDVEDALVARRVFDAEGHSPRSEGKPPTPAGGEEVIR